MKLTEITNRCTTCGVESNIDADEQCRACLLEERVEELERLIHKMKECFTWLR